MDRDRLCAFFNRLQVLQDLRPRSALSGMAQAVQSLNLTSIGAEFAVARDGVATVLLRLTGLSAVDRYSILKDVLAAGNIERLAHAISDHVAQGTSPTDARVSATLEFIQAASHDPRRCGLGYLAKRVDLSPCYLSRLFHKHTGRRLADQVRQIRVEKASTLILTEPHLPLRLVAEAVGYRDDAELCHNFKLVTGCSPKQYLRLRQS